MPVQESEFIWRVSGGSGDGIDSTSQNFAKALMRSGLHVFTHRHYPSRIRGGHTYVEVRASDDPVRSRGDGYNCLLALGDSFARNPQENAYYGNEEIKPLTENLDDLREDGIIVYDSGLIDADELPDDFDERVDENNWNVYPVDLRSLAREHGREVMRNTAGVGVISALVGFDPAPIKQLLNEVMSGDILAQNETVLAEAYDLVDDLDITHDWRIPTGTHEDQQVLLSGSLGVAYGAMDEGCQFVSGYPMTPWTDVFTIMSQLLPEHGGVAEQVEDEIAACSLAVGASHAGAKALTGSSGGGFSLMSEPLGMAEMTETPLVLIEAMRGGPSTGLPTKPEQADLEHVLYTSQGDSCRIVFAPGNVREAYQQTRRAFQLAYEYQLPAVVIIDQKLSGELRTVDEAFFDQPSNGGNLGSVTTEDAIASMPHHPSGKFNRYQYAENLDGKSVSPRSLPGQADGRFLATGNEHNEQGHISEDPENREKMHGRRLAKPDDIRNELDNDDASHQTVYGDADADVGILTFGSQQGTVFEAVDALADSGHAVQAMSVSDLKPYPTDDVQAFLDALQTCVVVEMNGTGQFHNLTKQHVETRRRPQDIDLISETKFNGNPFVPSEIVDAVTKVIDE